MRTIITTLLFILALAPLRAQTPAPNAADACKQLEAQALKLTSEKVCCEAGLDGLVLSEVSASGLKVLEIGLFPEQRYLGHAIVAASAQVNQTPLQPSAIMVKAQAAELEAAKTRVESSPVLAQAAIGNFDNSVTRVGLASGKDALASRAHSETLADAVADIPMVKADMSSGKNARFVLVQQGPPGSGGGPPGSGNGPPGSGRDPQTRDPRQGPPGSKPPHQGPPAAAILPAARTRPAAAAPRPRARPRSGAATSRRPRRIGGTPTSTATTGGPDCLTATTGPTGTRATPTPCISTAAGTAGGTSSSRTGCGLKTRPRSAAPRPTSSRFIRAL